MITFFHFAVSFVCFQATTETEEAVVDYAMDVSADLAIGELCFEFQFSLLIRLCVVQYMKTMFWVLWFLFLLTRCTVERNFFKQLKKRIGLYIDKFPLAAVVIWAPWLAYRPSVETTS